MVVVIVLLTLFVFTLAIRVWFLEQAVSQLGLDLMELEFDIEDLSAQQLAEEMLEDWDLGDTHYASHIRLVKDPE
jgi:hypothetical protein